MAKNVVLKDVDGNELEIGKIPVITKINGTNITNREYNDNYISDIIIINCLRADNLNDELNITNVKPNVEIYLYYLSSIKPNILNISTIEIENYEALFISQDQDIAIQSGGSYAIYLNLENKTFTMDCNGLGVISKRYGDFHKWEIKTIIDYTEL